MAVGEPLRGLLVILVCLCWIWACRAAERPVAMRAAPAGESPRAPAEASSRPAVQRLPVPASQEITEARALVRRTLDGEFAAARTTRQRGALAARLLEQGLATRDQPAVRYVLLYDAAQTAASAGEARTIFRAIDALALSYDADTASLRIELLSTALDHAAGTGLAVLAECCVDAAEQSARDDLYPDALRLQSVGQRAASRSRDLALLTRLQQLREQLVAQEQAYAAAREALATLADAPDDPDASLVAGRFLCLAKGDWETGLPILASAADGELSAAAQLDTGAATAADQLEAGHRWWQIAQSLSGPMQRNALARAAMHYRHVLGGLRGFSLTLVQKRLADMDAAEVQRRRLAPGLLSELFAGQDFGDARRSRIDEVIDFDWGTDGPGDGLPKDDFSIRFSGVLRIDVAGRYSFIIIANDRAKLIIDDRTILEGVDLGRRRTGIRAAATLTEGFHTMRLEFSDHSGTAKCRLLWSPPGSDTDAVVPADHFYHPDPDR